MSWSEINQSADPALAKKQAKIRLQNASDLAKSYHRAFTTDDGQRILSDLTKRFVYDNDTSFGSGNINYEAAYHNGEAGVIKFLINQMKQAEILQDYIMLDEQAATEEAPRDTLLDQANPSLEAGEYFLSDGIKGTGETPEWLNTEKYKSVAEQAKGYAELSKRFGGFKGAPKDGYSLPEGVEKDDALYQELEAFATKNNMNGDAFTEAWELLSTQGQVAEQYNQEAELSKLGDNAQQRIKTVESFMKNNLDADTYEKARGLVNNAETIELVEMLVRATAPTKLPMEGGHNPEGLSWESIEAEMFKKDESGQMLRSVSVAHEQKIQKMMEAWGGSQQFIDSYRVKGV